MKLMMGMGAAAAVAGGMYWHGDFRGGRLYGMPAQAVYAEIDDLRPHENIESVNTALSGTYLRLEHEPGAAVKWAFYHQSDRIGSLVARIRNEGEQRTRVNVAFEPGEGDEAKWRTKDVRQFLKVVVQPMMAEQIDATLEKREFDRAVLTNALTGYVMANTGALQREGLRRMDDAREMERMTVGEIGGRIDKEQWYKDAKTKAMTSAAASGVRSDARPMTDLRPETPAQPMTDLSR